MTTTTLSQADSQLANLRREKATITNRVPLTELFAHDPERMIKFGIERIEQADREQAVWDAARLAEIATEMEQVQALIAELEKVACHKCRGTGQYNAPTSHYRNGIPACFTCSGTGRRRTQRS